MWSFKVQLIFWEHSFYSSLERVWFWPMSWKKCAQSGSWSRQGTDKGFACKTAAKAQLKVSEQKFYLYLCFLYSCILLNPPDFCSSPRVGLGLPLMPEVPHLSTQRPASNHASRYAVVLLLCSDILLRFIWLHIWLQSNTNVLQDVSVLLSNDVWDGKHDLEYIHIRGGLLNIHWNATGIEG